MKELLKAVDFPVKLAPIDWHCLETDAHIPIHGRQAVVRTDTGRAISIVSDQYHLVPHREILEPVIETIESLGVSGVERQKGRRQSPLRVENDGARVWLEGINRHIGFDLGADRLEPRIVVGNSYDKTSSLRVIFGFYQVRCTNAGALMKPGQVRGFGEDGSFSVHHTQREVSKIDQLKDSLARFFEGFPAKVESLRGMLNSKLTDSQMSELEKGYLGERFIKKQPPEAKDRENAWAFYARITNYLTLDSRGGQQNVERRAAQALVDIQQLMRQHD